MVISINKIDFFEDSNNLFIKRGGIELQLQDDGAHYFKQIHTVLKENNGIPLAELKESCADIDEAVLSSFVSTLIEKNILVLSESILDTTDEDDSYDVFLTQFNASKKDLVEKLNNHRFLLFGSLNLTYKIATLLSEWGGSHIQIATLSKDLNTMPSFLNTEKISIQPIQKFEDAFDNSKISAVLYLESRGIHEHLQVLNKLCFEKEVTFFPAFIYNTTAYLGPISDRESACFDCLFHRAQANDLKWDLKMKFTEHSNAEKGLMRPPTFIEDIFVSTFFIECLRYFGELSSEGLVNQVLELDMLHSKTDKHPLLKIPMCEVCSRENKYPNMNWLTRHFESLKLQTEAPLPTESASHP